MTVFVWILLCIIWGTTWIFIKIGLEDLPPITFAALRFSISILLLAPYLLLKKPEIPRDWETWKLLGFTGLLQFFLNYSLLFWGEQYISSGLAAVLQATIPAFGLFLARIYVGEEINLTKILSMVCGLIGIVIIFSEQLNINGRLALFGSFAVVIGAFGASYASVLTKARLRTYDPAVLMFFQMLIGIVPMWIVGVSFETFDYQKLFTLKALVCLFYLAIVGSIMAFWLYYWLLARIEVSKAMMIAFVTPLIAIVIGAVFLDEKIPPQTMFGGIFVLISVVLIVIKKKQKAS
jgi:drug/metabolite transporter (DMT)-like permease